MTHENFIDLGSDIDKSSQTVRLSLIVTCECEFIAVFTVVFHTVGSDLKFSFSLVLNTTAIKETMDRNTRAVRKVKNVCAYNPRRCFIVRDQSFGVFSRV